MSSHIYAFLGCHLLKKCLVKVSLTTMWRYFRSIALQEMLQCFKTSNILKFLLQDYEYIIKIIPVEFGYNNNGVVY